MIGLGAVVCALGLAAFVAQSGPAATLVQFLPAFLGLPLVAGALAPVHGGGSRTTLAAGTGLVFCSVVLAGLFQAVDSATLLFASVATVLAWDAGEHAIGVGEQLGRDARTWRLEATHVLGTALVGALGVAAIRVANGFVGGGASLTSYVTTALAAILLAAALRR